MAKKITITITGSHLHSGKLDQSDKGTTEAPPGAEITWFLANKCGVASITAISPKDKSRSTIWSKQPGKLGSSTMWVGTINATARSQKEEWDYNIEWIDDTDENPHTYDPKIIVNSSVE